MGFYLCKCKTGAEDTSQLNIHKTTSVYSKTAERKVYYTKTNESLIDTVTDIRRE